MDLSKLKNNLSEYPKAMSDDLSDRFMALIRQERFYQCDDYLKLRKDPSVAVNQKCRYSMTNWCYQVLDYCNASQETASIAISYVDRFLSSSQGSFVLNDKNWFQLAVMCSLQLAIKVNESSKLEVDTLSQLSRGLFSVEDITLMEKAMLSALSWRLCPATPYVFLDFFLDLLPPSLSSTTKMSLLKLAQKQIYLASPYYLFTLEKSSAIAFASLLNAMDEIRCTTEAETLICCANQVGYNYLDDTSLDLRRKLFSLINPGSNEGSNNTLPCIPSSNNSAQKQRAVVCVRS